MSSQAVSEPQTSAGVASLSREIAWAALCLLIGIVVMPCVIFLAGRLSLGPYQHGGVFALWRDFLAGLAHGSEAFWFVAIVPYLMLWLLRATRRLWSGERRPHS